ncbi:response regulator transcription factor [Scatolibacter rhodanostii]|uniref:response regulator transcription factor n=1 Tax=Scatolibacter rhodanostii TaxID=2014781 RepID=UPI001FA9315C|nr:response regulator transcription factor [Scatolibacter rhodanostii]
MENNKIKVLVAEDILPIMKRYTKILEKAADIEVVAAVQSGYEAVLLVGIHRPDVILMDIEMETRTSGLDATREILHHFPDTKIVILTVYEDDETIFNAFQMGVCDYILKNSNPEEIITCIKDAYYNRSPIRPVIAEKIRSEFQRIYKAEKSLLYCLHLITQLTQTEVDILDLLNKGYTRKQICEVRYVEMSTVKTQIHNILKKFEMSNIVEVLELLNSMNVFEYLHNMKHLGDEKA